MEEMDRNRTEQGRQVHMGNTYIQYIYIYIKGLSRIPVLLREVRSSYSGFHRIAFILRRIQIRKKKVPQRVELIHNVLKLLIPLLHS